MVSLDDTTRTELLPSLFLLSLSCSNVSALVKMFHKNEPWAMAPPVEQQWTPELWNTLWDKLEICTSIEPKSWEAKHPMGVLKYLGKFVQTPKKHSKERLFHARCMAQCLLFAYKVAVEKNTELEKQTNKTRTYNC